MEKTVYIGTTAKKPIFCVIELNNGKLSIYGVFDPKNNGEAESCGQIDMDFKHKDNDEDAFIGPDEIEFGEGWNKELWYKFLNIWDKYHLNDMSPGCEHQRELGWGNKKINISEWQLKSKTLGKINKIKKKADSALKNDGKVKISEKERNMLNLPFKIKGDTLKGRVPEDFEDYYVLNKTKKIYEGHIKENEHPEGKLCKECPKCGYKFGTKWLKEELPDEVIEFLKNLPESDVKPAWV